MSTYYAYQDVKVAIVHRLFKLEGWKIYGYHASQSDPYNDYWDPEHWDGIAEKNGYRLVVDHSRAQAERRYTVRTSAQAALDAKTAAKIRKLEEMTQARGASEREEETARKAIEILRNKAQEAAQGETATSEIYEPGYMANPPRCNWHIEKDGIIIDKGTGLLKYANVPDITDERELKEWQRFNNLSADDWKAETVACFINAHYYRTDEEAAQVAEYRYNEAGKKYQLLESFNLLINRFNTICGGMVGNSDEFYTYEEVTKTEYKTEIKPQETEAGSIAEGQYFIVKRSFTGGICKGYVYIIHEHDGTNGKKWYTANRMNGKNTKELTGSANPANHFGFVDESRFNRWLEKGAIAFCDLVEVKTPYEVKKVVKTKTKNAKQSHDAPKAEKTTEEHAEAETTAAEQESAENADTPEAQDTCTAEESGSETEQETAPEAEPEKTPETETEAEKEPTAAAEAAVPDMFSTLAAAYFSGKTVKKAKKAEATQPPKEEAAPEAEQDAQPAEAVNIPENPDSCTEEPPAPGYHENNNDRFTIEERRTLADGQTVKKPDMFNNSEIFFSAPYSESVRLVYRVHVWGKQETIPPGSEVHHSGFLCGIDFYSNYEAIKKKFFQDINAKLMELIPDEETAAKHAQEDDYIKRIREYSQYSNAQRAFYEGRKPTLWLYENQDCGKEELIRYIVEPDMAIQDETEAYIKNRASSILAQWIEYNNLSADYNRIVSNPDNEEHKRLKISQSIGEQKTVRIELTYGPEVKVEADAVKRIVYSGYISNYHVAAQDRQHLKQSKYGRPEDIQIAEIAAIRHGGHVLYSA